MADDINPWRMLEDYKNGLSAGKFPREDEVRAKAADIARKAAELVSGDRDRQHGQMRENFTRIAMLWNAYLGTRKDPAAPLDAVDVGLMMNQLKVARTQSGAVNIDDFIDGAGYLACAGEIALGNS